MNQTTRLIEALKKSLRARGLGYRDVARALDLSEASVKRIFASGNFSLKRLEAVCALLDMSLHDLTRLAGTEAETVTTLTLKQEEALATDPRLLTCFYLLLNGWTPDQIADRYRLDDLLTVRMLAALDRLKLIELYPDNRVRLRTARTIAWRRDGPVRKLYERQARAEFLDTAFTRPDESLNFATGQLSAPSVRLLQRKIDRLLREFDELVELDMALPLPDKTSVALLVAARPWVFSVFEEQKQ